MKLERLQVTNYRSLFEDRLDLELASGMNSIIGPNNCGKSNVLRALALALDPDSQFDRAIDMHPGAGPNTLTRIICDFRLNDSFRESTLRRYVIDAERSVSEATATYAEEGLIRFSVTCSATRRTPFFVSKGAIFSQPKNVGQLKATNKALKQFHNLCRFVYVESGDSLENLLRGRFREVLRTVLQESQSNEYEQADAARTLYIAALRSELLDTLEVGVIAELGQLVPELTSVDLEPRVTPLEESLLDIDVQLRDAVRSGLANKGTGVRAGVLIGMLQYLAKHGKRSVVFAVEEPESFLHPAAQELLRADMEALAQEDDVSLLVTTHSPFIPSRAANSRLFTLNKRPTGSTELVDSVAGDKDRTRLLLSLFSNAAQPDLLERAARSEAHAFLVVEGKTDRLYLELVCELLGRNELLEGVLIIDSKGAKDAVSNAIILRDELPHVPLRVILDDDPDGKRARERLRQDFSFKAAEVLCYSAILKKGLDQGVVEAEDLFDTKLVTKFVGHDGSLFSGWQNRSANWGPGWENERHYDLTKVAKDRFPDWLRRHCKVAHVGRWSKFLDVLETRLK